MTKQYSANICLINNVLCMFTKHTCTNLPAELTSARSHFVHGFFSIVVMTAFLSLTNLNELYTKPTMHQRKTIRWWVTYNLISLWKSSWILFSLLSVDIAAVFKLSFLSSCSLGTVMSILSIQSSSWTICSSFCCMPGCEWKKNTKNEWNSPINSIEC